MRDDALLRQGLKQCFLCKQVKPHAEFYPRGDSGYVTSACKACYAERYKNNADKYRKAARDRRLGIDPDTYDNLVKAFGAKCMICGIEDPMGTGAVSGTFSIDHNKDTGMVRGLLCCNCNVGIGMLNHDIKLLEKAITYLKFFEHGEL